VGYKERDALAELLDVLERLRAEESVKPMEKDTLELGVRIIAVGDREGEELKEERREIKEESEPEEEEEGQGETETVVDLVPAPLLFSQFPVEHTEGDCEIDTVPEVVRDEDAQLDAEGEFEDDFEGMGDEDNLEDFEE